MDAWKPVLQPTTRRPGFKNLRRLQDLEAVFDVVGDLSQGSLNPENAFEQRGEEPVIVANTTLAD